MVGMSLAVFLASQGIKPLAMLTESEKFASPVSLLIYLDITTRMPES